MKRILTIVITLNVVLFSLLFIPLLGEVENSFVLFLGRFHPLVLHLPIGALIILFLMEVINELRPNLNLDSACNILLWFSVITVIPTAIIGFFLASGGNYNDEALGKHQWLGWFTALICVWLLVFRQRKFSESQKKGNKLYKGFLFVNVVLLSLAGHYGGSLTHGSNYLTRHMPSGLKSVLGVEDEYLAANTKRDSTSEEAIYFTNKIKPVMEKYCYECHNIDKQKGGVRLDILDWDMIHGPDAEGWHSALDMINSGEMPPEDELQIEKEERRLVVEWMTSNLEAAAKAKKDVDKGVMRRLTKQQYTNSLNELLNVFVNFGDVLPDDGKSEMGFSNNGSVLQTTALHIDYYQKIAREALDKAIVFGDKPEVMKYRVAFGKEISDGKEGYEFWGYQTAAIKKKDLKIDILNNKGIPFIVDTTKVEVDTIAAIKNKIGIGMRGSASNRYAVVKEGVILNSALPAKEVAPKSWQGPSPNLKMLIKEDFPRSGDFVFRVEASRGYNSWSEEDERLIDLRKNVPAKQSSEAIRINADNVLPVENLRYNNKRFLMPEDVAAISRATFGYNVPKTGVYQIDLVHPYAADDAMPSFSMNLLGGNKNGLVSKRLYLKKEQKDASEITTPISLIYLTKGKHEGFIGGKFFVGLNRIVLTPLSEEDLLEVDLQNEAQKNNLKYKSINPSIQVFAGSRTDDGMDYKTFDVSKEVTAPLGESQHFEFKGRLENLPIPLEGSQVSGDLANIITIGLWNDHLVKESSFSGPPLLIKSVEFEAPYIPVWPPESHTEIFFDSPNKANKELYTEEVLGRFIERAFRRDLNPGELNRYMDFWRSVKDDFERYENGVKEVLVAVLCSPSFIYLYQPEKLEEEKKSDDEFYLASQLAYFLWNSPPDNTLTALASEGDLHDKLPEQVERMVKDSKISRMVHSFAYEWLRLDRHKKMDTDVRQYSDYTRFVKEDMAQETYEFVNYVLKNNMSIMNFIDSDFAMLNQNLAEFYEIEGVQGNEFRPVALAEETNRGGLLSQGAFLNGHSDGVQAHPIKRGVWLKEKILGESIPLPPPNVPELDPETPGFEDLTLKEQLFLHRNKESCIDCHLKIDPYGVVFENYDAVGRYQLMAKGKPVDSKTELPDGIEVEGIKGLKDYILKLRKEDFARTFIEYLYAYAVGHDVTYVDQEEIDNILAEVIEDDFRIQTVITQIVKTPSFYKKEKSWFHKIFGL